MLSLNIIGLRGAEGRFARAANHEVAEACYEAAAELAAYIEHEFSEAAPRSGMAQHEDGSPPLGDSIKAFAVPTGWGFELEVSTSEPEIMRYVREGHGDIYPSKPDGVLHWRTPSGEDVFTRHVGPVEGNPWEEETKLRLEPLIHERGNRIGIHVMERLGGPAV